MEWVLILFFIQIYIGYLIICTIWLILGVILNFQAFIPICAGVLAFYAFAMKVSGTLNGITMQVRETVGNMLME